MSLSTRANAAAKPSNSNTISTVLSDPWHPKSSPSGFVNLGLAENALMHDVLQERVLQTSPLPKSACTYGDGFTGSNRLKRAVSQVLNRYLTPVEPIAPEHVIVTNGCSAALEQLAWAIADPGDSFLLGRPYYTRLAIDPSLRTGASIIPVSFGDTDPLGPECVAAYASAIEETEAIRGKIAGLLLCNPHNPLGRCYSRDTLLGLLKLCQKHQIHAISDETYALSVWSDQQDTAPFESCLTLATPNIIDPALVHIVWGLSKDFGANGFRVGAIVSQHNAALRASLLQGAIDSSVSSISDHISAELLEDHVWVDNYVTANKRKLREHYQIAVNWADDKGITYATNVSVAFFLWVDLGSALRARTQDREIANIDVNITQALMREKVFVATGAAFGSEKPGWYRVVFSVDKEMLGEGLRRIVRALEK